MSLDQKMHTEEDKILSPRGNPSLWEYAEKSLRLVNQTFPVDTSLRSDASAALSCYRATEQLLSVLKMIIEKQGDHRDVDQLSSDVSLMMNNVTISQSPSPVPVTSAFSHSAASSPSSPLLLENGTPRKRPRSQMTESRMSPLDLSRISSERGVQPGPQSAERISQRLPSIHQILSDRELRPLHHHACETPRGFRGNNPAAAQGTTAGASYHHFSSTPQSATMHGNISPRYTQGPLSPSPTSPRGGSSPFTLTHFSGSGGASPTPAANRKQIYQSQRPPSVPNMTSPGVTFTDRPYEVVDDKKGMFGHFSVLNSATGDQTTDFPHEKEKRQRRKKNADIDLKCLECSTRETPEWRRGPKGPKTLCNACGLKYAKKLKQQQQQQQRQQQTATK